MWARSFTSCETQLLERRIVESGYINTQIIVLLNNIIEAIGEEKFNNIFNFEAMICYVSPVARN